MQRTTIRAGLAAALALALAAPAQAQTAEPVTTTYFMTCGGPAKVQNANGPASMTPSWSTSAPTQSFTAGAGCGFADTPLINSDTTGGPTGPFDAYFGGAHAGAIDKAEIEVHSLVLSRVRAPGAVNRVRVRILVGGEEIYNNGIEDAVAKPSTTGASESFTFKADGLKIPAGAAGRQLLITIGTAGQGANAWVGGATEVPTKVTFTAPVPKTTS